MKFTAANGGLRRLLFAGGLAATGAAALLSPDWSSVLKAQGYYGNVDLGIEASAPARLTPGKKFFVYVTVRNQGPDTAHRVRTIATSQGLVYVGGHDCDEPRYPRCALADSMDVGNLSYALYMQVAYDARNHVQFSASVASDDTEVQPGDEIVVMKMPIYVPLDLRSDIACERAGAAGATVRCSIRFSNEGSFAARLPQLQASVAAPAQSSLNWRCEPSALCAGAAAQGNGYTVTPASLPVGNPVTFFVEVTQPGAAQDIALDADARLNPAMGETELNSGNNRSTLQFSPSLFAHDFEPAG